MSGPDAAAMVEDLRQWSAELTRAHVTVADLAAAIGTADGDVAGPQVDVRPHHGTWALATIVDGSSGDGPSHVILRPAAALATEDLDDVFGSPGPPPPRIHFDAPEQRVHTVDTGQPRHTAAVIAEIPAGSSGPVQTVVLRRDPRLQ